MAPRMQERGAFRKHVQGILDVDADIDDLTTTNTEQMPQNTTTRTRGRLPEKKIMKSSSRATRVLCREPDSKPSSSRDFIPPAPSNRRNRSPLRPNSPTSTCDEGTRTQARSARRGRGRPKLTETIAADAFITTSVATGENLVKTEPAAATRIIRNRANYSTAVDELSMADAKFSLVGDGFVENDVFTQRRLGELSTRHEDLKKRHRDLRELGLKAAEHNFHRLKKQTEGSLESSNRLILQLREDLAEQTALAEHRKDMEENLERSEANAKRLQAEVERLSADLSLAREQVSMLSERLSSTQTAR
ncbi:hypothetical protein CDD80_978 [Ophiocordyceps camponoti-rufipedis]|uniref:Uncharacterized protein n=1 Tax=Ophiocordyceps camponoti-rufipedis TaxID=2004952 RepID=A0A2C5ZB77_9HYPO|nr:hypothetical protein CDD80_978 [Ophiocordyceps camponoti-rufipedis]